MDLTNNTPVVTILSVVRVVDTRRWEVGPSGAHPIPGSGDANTCERCGTTHEVHVYVRLSDGRTAVVGETCATRESAEIRAAVKTSMAAQKALAAARAKVANLGALTKAWDAYIAMIAQERGLRSYESDAVKRDLYALRARTTEHFASLGLSTWWCPPTGDEIAKTHRALAKAMKVAGEAR